MRQEVPQLFTSRLQTEVDNMNLNETGLLDDPARLREAFIARMTNLINEAQDAAVEAYRQKSAENCSQGNQLMTPGPSSSSGSLLAMSQQSSRPSREREEASSTRRPVPSWPREFQSIDDASTDDAVNDYLMTQMGQRVESSGQTTQTKPNLPQPLMQVNNQSESSNSRLEPTSEGRSSSVTELQDEHDPKLYDPALDWEESNDWYWLNNDFS